MARCGAGAGRRVLPFGRGQERQADLPGRSSPRAEMPVLPLTQLDEKGLAADLDNRAFTLTFAQPVPIRDLLLLLVRGTNLSIVPDPAITGTFIGELKNVTVRQALGLILPPLGLDYTVDGRFIRVFKREPETRLFDINYVADATHRRVAVRRRHRGASSANVTSTMHRDVFAELAKGVQTLLSERATFNVDRKAGLLQVTDFPGAARSRRGVPRCGAGPRPPPGADRRARHRSRAERREGPGRSTGGAAFRGDGRRAGRRRAAAGPGRSRPVSVSPTSASFMTALAAGARCRSSPTRGCSRSTTSRRSRTLDGSGFRFNGRRAGVTLSITPQIAGDGVGQPELSPMVKLRPGSDADVRRESGYAASPTATRSSSGGSRAIGKFVRGSPGSAADGSAGPRS